MECASVIFFLKCLLYGDGCASVALVGCVLGGCMELGVRQFLLCRKVLWHFCEQKKIYNLACAVQGILRILCEPVDELQKKNGSRRQTWFARRILSQPQIGHL